METKHTPGPWSAGVLQEVNANTHYQAGHRIYMPGGAAALVYSMGASRDEVAANAALIAEAPALVDALRGLVECCDFDSNDPEYPILANARAVLASVDGAQ